VARVAIRKFTTKLCAALANSKILSHMFVLFVSAAPEHTFKTVSTRRLKEEHNETVTRCKFLFAVFNHALKEQMLVTLRALHAAEGKTMIKARKNSGHPVVCPDCARSGHVIRVPRTGGKRMLSLFGFFPFYCRFCKREFYDRHRATRGT
jgi:hypothetical protein